MTSDLRQFAPACPWCATTYADDDPGGDQHQCGSGQTAGPATVLDAALWVARELGCYVFPVDHPALPKCAGVPTRDHDPDSCDKRGKHPAVPKFSIDATSTLRDITAMFSGTTRNYGIATRQSRLLVIDEDTATLAQYAASIGETVPETFEVSTGRGRHLWFRVPLDAKLGNARGKLPKGIDVRAGGNGYVIGPGSVHANGTTYTATWDRRPVPAPQWLIDALTFEPTEGQGADGNRDDLPDDAREMLSLPCEQGERSERFYGIVATCRAAGVSKAATVAAVTPWCARVGKFVGREAAEVDRIWHKVKNVDEWLDSLPDAEKEGEPARFQLRDRLLRRSELKTIKAARYLILDTLELDSETWLIGSPGGFKSFVALDWACRVVTGCDWAGQKVRQGNVLYVAAEGARGILQRILAWEQHNQVRVGDEFVLLPQAVYGVQKTRDGIGQHPMWRELRSVATELRPNLIVLDTQARMTIGLEENNNSDMSAWVESVTALKRDTGACVLVVHHVGRNGKDARGASSIDGAQDMEWKVTRVGAKEALTAALRMEKNKDGRDDIEWTLTMKSYPVGVDDEGRTITSLAGDVTRAKTEQVILDHEQMPTSAQIEVLYVLRHLVHQDGDTQAALLAKVNEIRREKAAKSGWEFKPMTKGVLSKSLSTQEGLGGLLEKGWVTRPTATKWALRADAPDTERFD